MSASKSVKYLNVRFLERADSLIRRRLRHQGDLSVSVQRCMRSVDLGQLPLENMQRGAKRPATQVGLPVPMWEAARTVCAERKCSLNALINSAILHHLQSQ